MKDAASGSMRMYIRLCHPLEKKRQTISPDQVAAQRLYSSRRERAGEPIMTMSFLSLALAIVMPLKLLDNSLDKGELDSSFGD